MELSTTERRRSQLLAGARDETRERRVVVTCDSGVSQNLTSLANVASLAALLVFSSF